MKNRKSNFGFLYICKVWQILKCFAETFCRAQTLKLEGVFIYFSFSSWFHFGEIGTIFLFGFGKKRDFWEKYTLQWAVGQLIWFCLTSSPSVKETSLTSRNWTWLLQRYYCVWHQALVINIKQISLTPGLDVKQNQMSWTNFIWGLPKIRWNKKN